MSAWGLTNVNGTAELVGMDGMVMGMLEEGAAIEGIAMYWVAPEDYVGNRVSDEHHTHLELQVYFSLQHRLLSQELFIKKNVNNFQIEDN